MTILVKGEVIGPWFIDASDWLIAMKLLNIEHSILIELQPV